MVEITQEENPIVEKLKICTVVSVFAPLGKTLLQFRLSSRVTNFFCLIGATGYAFFRNPKKICSKTFFEQHFERFLEGKKVPLKKVYI